MYTVQNNTGNVIVLKYIINYNIKIFASCHNGNHNNLAMRPHKRTVSDMVRPRPPLQPSSEHVSQNVSLSEAWLLGLQASWGSVEQDRITISSPLSATKGVING